MGEKKSDKKAHGDKKGPITVILTVDLEGFQEKVKVDLSGNKLKVVGKVDHEKIRDRVESKTKKKVETTKDKDNKGGKKKKDENRKRDEEQKTKEPAATTVVLKVRLCCEGCIQRIRQIISETKGLELVALDSEKDLLTLKGTIDFKVYLTDLQKKMKRKVEIVPPKKEEEGKKDKQGKKKGKEERK